MTIGLSKPVLPVLLVGVFCIRWLQIFLLKNLKGKGGREGEGVRGGGREGE